MLSSNLKLEQLKRKFQKNAKNDIEKQTQDAKAKWEKLIHYMLNIDNIQRLNEFNGGISERLVNFLDDAKFV